MSLINDTAAPIDDDPRGGASAFATPGGPSVWNTLDPFPLEFQEEGWLWCWAATAVSVANYFKKSVWDQCGLANTVLSRSDCCTLPRPADCNKEYNLTEPLRKVGHFGGRSGGAWTLTQIRAIINSQRPLGVRVEWPVTKAGHFLLVTGYSDADEVQVHDPDPKEGGMSRLDYDTLKSNYTVGVGSWTHSYETVR